MSELVQIHSELNPIIWNTDRSMKSEIREQLLIIANAFLESIEIPIEVADIFLVGSQASYNYTEHSDLDVHIVANFEVLPVSKEIALSIYNQYKINFNKEYDITVKGLAVELYIEDICSGTASNGVFSILNDEWVKIPYELSNVGQIAFSVDSSALAAEANYIIENGSIDDVKDILNRIYLMRKNSIAIDGEFGLGNLIFKSLRNVGILDGLKNKLRDLYSKQLSLESLQLTEATRRDLLGKSKSSAKGMQRYKRRVKSRVVNSTKEFNKIDMNSFFKKDKLDVSILVHGETDNYLVRVSFSNVLDELYKQLNRGKDELTLRHVIRALVASFNRDDVYISCSCPDFYYRFSYQATENKYNSGEPQMIPANITNPNDSLGSGCKHTLLVLANHSWIIKTASVIFNYINYMKSKMPKSYANIIYPAIYRKDYEDDYQVDMFSKDDELIDDEETISDINAYAKDKGKFKAGNKSGVRFAKEPEVEDDEPLFV